MKKTLFYLCLAAGLLSCAKETVPQEQTAASAGVPVKFEISVAGTKADGGIARQDWAAGDAISVFIMGIPGKYLVLSYDGSSWTTTPVGGEITDIEIGGLEDNYFLTAVHFPVEAGIAYEDNGEYAKNRFTFKSGGQPVYGSYYLYDEKEPFTVTDGTTVNATLAMRIPAGMVQLYFPGGEGRDNLNDYTLASPMIRPVACAGVGLDGTIQESVLQRGARIGGGMPYGQGIIFAGRYDNPGEAAGHHFSLANDEEIWTIDINRGTDLFEGGMLYTFPNFPGGGWSVQLSSDLYVDLGTIVNGKKIYWAKCNLGAATETGYGDYFAWGETTGYNEGKTNFDWSTYLFDNSASHDGSSFSKYTGSDFDTLKPEDDAAYAALGGKFRMPTSAEIDMLHGLRKEWVYNYNGSGIAGYKFTGSNEKTLFLPAAGHRDGTNLIFAGNVGYYWSSSLYRGSMINAWHFLFITGGSFDTGGIYRFFGYSVRPVFSE